MRPPGSLRRSAIKILSTSTQFVIAAREAAVHLDLVTEQGRFDRSAMAQISRIIARHQPDIIQTHNVKSHFLITPGSEQIRATIQRDGQLNVLEEIGGTAPVETKADGDKDGESKEAAA